MKYYLALFVFISSIPLLAKSPPIKIGFIGGLTSESMSKEAHQAQNAMVMAIKEQNLKGGLLGRTVELESVDSQNDPLQTEANVAELKRRGVIAAVGFMGGDDDIQLSKFLERARIPAVAEASTDPSITEDKKYIVATCTNDKIQAKELAQKLISIGKKKLILVTNLANPFNVLFERYFTGYFKEIGGTIVSSHEMDIEYISFKKVAKDVFQKDTIADAIMLNGTTGDSVSLWVELHRLGVKTDIISVDTIEYYAIDDIIKDFKSDFNISLFNGFVNLNHLNKAGQRFFSEFNNHYPDIAITGNSFDAPFTYDSVKILLKAIDQAGSTDPDKIMKSLKTVRIEGITGRLGFKENGQTIRPMKFLRIRKGIIEDAD